MVRHRETHFTHRLGWLRAAVLGANDGIISTASLVAGVSASGVPKSAVLIAGIAGLVAGSMSMAAGEYVSVSSQSDSENADLERERSELERQPEYELQELADRFIVRGVAPDTAVLVAKQMTKHDALAAHAQEELGMANFTKARPFQAASASAFSFIVGATAPLLAVLLSPKSATLWIVGVSTIVLLGILGAMGASLGGAGITKGTARTVIWGMTALAVTALVGRVFGTVV
ncbi:MAG TPA: VIT family protein [Marinobacter sp.]|uniref:VIT family protein n=2 Tax=root TaxID=1 RepID=A0A831R4X9_9GAMM|nr:VIT family protein [Marinobacter antarcticus]HDZ37727.1 VIT family protein [Marinobacter sp.]HEA53846.1 VIT family protein [Marinobacter antarcticus]